MSKWILKQEAVGYILRVEEAKLKSFKETLFLPSLENRTAAMGNGTDAMEN